MTNSLELGKFVITSHLGNGAYGDVYLAHDRALDVDRAVKILRSGDPRGFLEAFREAQILEKCRHAHIVDVKEADVAVFTGNLVAYIAMEYLGNGSLQARIERGFVSVRDACRFTAQALLGLEHAHTHRILHRDIKPANILLGEAGQAKLSDFGLALPYTPGTASAIRGYVTHLAPEALAGTAQGWASDIYAMGVTLYRLVTNRSELVSPYSSESDLQSAVERGKFPPRGYPPHVPRKVQRIISRAMRPTQEDRFQTSAAFRQSLEQLQFAVDWRQKGDQLWVGQMAGDNYRLEITPLKRAGWNVECRKNGRLVREQCYRVTDYEQAQELLLTAVRDSTLL